MYLTEINSKFTGDLAITGISMEEQFSVMEKVQISGLEL